MGNKREKQEGSGSFANLEPRPMKLFPFFFQLQPSSKTTKAFLFLLFYTPETAKQTQTGSPSQLSVANLTKKKNKIYFLASLPLLPETANPR